MVHHSRKGAGAARAGHALRGSSEFHAWGDSNLYLRRDSDDRLTLTGGHRAAPTMTTAATHQTPILKTPWLPRPTFRFPDPLQKTGSGSANHINFRDRRVIKQRDRAQLACATKREGKFRGRLSHRRKRGIRPRAAC